MEVSPSYRSKADTEFFIDDKASNFKNDKIKAAEKNVRILQ